MIAIQPCTSENHCVTPLLWFALEMCPWSAGQEMLLTEVAHRRSHSGFLICSWLSLLNAFALDMDAVWKIKSLSNQTPAERGKTSWQEEFHGSIPDLFIMMLMKEWLVQWHQRYWKNVFNQILALRLLEKIRPAPEMRKLRLSFIFLLHIVHQAVRKH